MITKCKSYEKLKIHTLCLIRIRKKVLADIYPDVSSLIPKTSQSYISHNATKCIFSLILYISCKQQHLASLLHYWYTALFFLFVHIIIFIIWIVYSVYIYPGIRIPLLLLSTRLLPIYSALIVGCIWEFSLVWVLFTVHTETNHFWHK